MHRLLYERCTQGIFRDSDRGRRGKSDVLGQEVEYVDADNWPRKFTILFERVPTDPPHVRNLEERERFSRGIRVAIVPSLDLFPGKYCFLLNFSIRGGATLPPRGSNNGKNRSPPLLSSLIPRCTTRNFRNCRGPLPDISTFDPPKILTRYFKQISIIQAGERVTLDAKRA